MASGARPSADSESEARQIASAQLGLISYSQARGEPVNLSEAAISRRQRDGLWERVLPRVYRIVGAQTSHAQSAMAATMWAGKGSLVSHATAAVLHDFEGIRSREVELWVPSGRGLRATGIAVHRGARLDRADRSQVGPIPVTTPTRTLIDMSGRLEDDRLLAVMEDLIRRGSVKADRLAARLLALRSSGRPGAGRLMALLDQRGDGRPLESRLEAIAWMLICRSGVPRPRRQLWVSLPGGRYRLDFGWPELRVGLECEGFEYHGDRSSRWGKDRARFAEFGSARWSVLPLTWDACRREPDRVVRWIVDAYRKAAAAA
jgi:very-short-patch-repair endonuclease